MVADGDYIVYLDHGKPVHAGKLVCDKVVSKWGERGQLWQHGVLEVPIKYGSDLRFFRQLPKGICLDAFKRWADLKLSG